MQHGILCFGIALLPMVTASAQNEVTLDEVRSTLSQWVETRQLTSRLQADWRSEKEMLEQTAALYEKELSGLNEQLAKTETGSAQVTEDRARLEAEEKELREAEAAVAEWVKQCEQRLGRLASAFPPPLASKLAELVKRMPDDPSETRLSPLERMQNVVGILNEVDKFNGSIVVESELQTRPSGEEIQVRTLYVGLGQAYFVDQTGTFSGVGRPSLEGWAWEEQAGLGERILRAIAIYDNSRPPAFEALPMSFN